MTSETQEEAGDIKSEGAQRRQSAFTRLWIFGANAKPNSLHSFFYRHGLFVRATHWVNAVILLFMLMSGLQIFNAHPALYFGLQSTFDHPVLSLTATTTSPVEMRVI